MGSGICSLGCGRALFTMRLTVKNLRQLVERSRRFETFSSTTPKVPSVFDSFPLSRRADTEDWDFELFASRPDLICFEPEHDEADNSREQLFR